MASPREAFLDTMARLLETQGYFASGLNQIVAESGAPKGSLYYYFPDGKEGLTVEVIERTSHVITERIRTHLAAKDNAADAVRSFLTALTRAVEATDCRGGGPIATVALETATTSERLRTACNAAYRAWQAAFAEKLVASGYDERRAQRFATLIIATIEGAVILCRTEHSAAPMEQVAEEIVGLLEMTRPPR
jgi:TetR/AcrR family transcriptional regulator, lmrAB and yxaGH operons repressor